MNLLVKGTNGPLTGEINVPTSKYHAHRALDFGVARTGNEPHPRPFRRAPRPVHDGRAARAGHENRSRRRHAARHRRPLSREAQRRLGRQLRLDALLHDRPRIVGRRARNADRTKVLPPPSGRTAARCARPHGRPSFDPPTAVRRSRSNRAARAAARSSFPARSRSGFPDCCCSRRSRRERTIIEVDGELNERPTSR